MKQYWDGRFWPFDWIHLPARWVLVDCYFYGLELVLLRRISVSRAPRTQGIHLPSICLPGECTNTLIGNANVNVKKQFRDDSFNLLIVIYIFLVVALTPEHKGHKGFNCLQFAYLVNAPTHWLSMLTLMLKEKAPTTV
jgi:hypothetical protein